MGLALSKERLSPFFYSEILFMSFVKPMPSVIPLSLPGVLLLETRRWRDARGWFTESWQAEDFSRVGIDVGFMQDNLVMNEHRGVLRGLHWQAEPQGQAKMVRCLMGEILDVAADVRPESPTFGQWVAVNLSEKKGNALFIPAGYAHGYVTRSERALVLYKVDQPWCPSSERAVRWNDPSLGIDWGINSPILSEKDACAPYL